MNPESSMYPERCNRQAIAPCLSEDAQTRRLGKDIDLGSGDCIREQHRHLIVGILGCLPIEIERD
jgi:hypothetical protein